MSCLFFFQTLLALFFCFQASFQKCLGRNGGLPDIFKTNLSYFKNIKYQWGGKSFKGIDCSALIQVCLNFNNKFCPRDTKDQFKYFKKNIILKNVKKNDIIYWKGHVAVALSKNKLIHAYGPLKKTILMDIDKTIKRIEKTGNLKIIGIKRI